MTFSSATPAPAAQTVREALSAALSLVFPTWFAGCDAPDTPLCAACREALMPHVRARRTGGLRVWSGLAFEGVAARTLRAAKEDGRTGLLRTRREILDADGLLFGDGAEPIRHAHTHADDAGFHP